MTYKRLTKKHVLITVTISMILIAGIVTYFVISPKSELSNKPNPNPGSGKTASPANKEVEQEQQAKNTALSKKLTEAPKDPKARCEITAKFNAEYMRDENIALETKRHEEYIKKFGSNRAEDYTHKQNLDRIQKQFDKSVKNINCK